MSAEKGRKCTRKPDPVRNCKVCGNPMTRKRFPSGRLEDRTGFLQREHCGETCARKTRDVNNRPPIPKPFVLDFDPERDRWNASGLIAFIRDMRRRNGTNGDHTLDGIPLLKELEIGYPEEIPRTHAL